MPVTTPGDIYEVMAVGTCFNQSVQLVHHYRLTAAPDPTEMSTVLDLILQQVRGGVGGGGILEANYLPLLPDSYILNKWQAQLIYPARYARKFVVRDIAGANDGSGR